MTTVQTVIANASRGSVAHVPSADSFAPATTEASLPFDQRISPRRRQTTQGCASCAHSPPIARCDSRWLRRCTLCELREWYTRRTRPAKAALVTLLNERRDIPLECAKFAQLRADLLEVRVRDGARIGAAACVVLHEPDQFAYLLDREAELSAPSDQLQPLHIRGAVSPLAACLSCREGQQSNLLVIANRRCRGARAFRETADGQALRRVGRGDHNGHFARGA